MVQRQLYLLPQCGDESSSQNLCATDHNTVQMKYALGSMYYVGSAVTTLDSWEHYTHTLLMLVVIFHANCMPYKNNCNTWSKVLQQQN